MAKVVRKSDRGARKRAEKEERIIKAATELIFAKGFEATKMDEIAQRADVSKGSLYLHFKTKDEIYLLIVARALRTMRDMFEEAVEGATSGLDRFGAIGLAFYRFTKDHPECSKLLYMEETPVPCPGSQYDEECRSLNQSIGMLMVSAIEQGMKDGSIRPDVDPLASALVISSSMQGFLRTLLREKGTISSLGLEEGHMVEQALELYRKALAMPDKR